jgi:hypothetical protein
VSLNVVEKVLGKQDAPFEITLGIVNELTGAESRQLFERPENSLEKLIIKRIWCRSSFEGHLDF